MFHWQVLLMDLVPDDKTAGLKTPVWAEYKQIVNAAEEREVSTVTFSSESMYHRSGKKLSLINFRWYSIVTKIKHAKCFNVE